MNPIDTTQTKPNQRNQGRRLNAAAVFAIGLALVFSIQCSKKQDSDTGTVHRKANRSPAPVLLKVNISPAEPSAVHLLRAVPTLKDPKRSNVSYKCKWFVNGDEVKDETAKVLDSKYYKKGDRVYCEMVASRNIHHSETIESTSVTIGNSNPVVNLDPVQPFPVPGTFRYTINASDPDGDTLTYSLVEPLGKGINIDPETGEITWEILEVPGENQSSNEPGSPEDESSERSVNRNRQPEDDGPNEELTPVVNILFEVRDSDGAVVSATITLNLKQGSEVPQ